MSKMTFVKVFAVIAAAVALISVVAAGRRDSVVPIVFSITPSAVSPGQNVSIEVELNQTVTSDQAVAITTSSPNNWSSLPSSVTVLAGHSSVTFSASVSNGASGSVNGTASCNGGSANQTVPVMQ